MNLFVNIDTHTKPVQVYNGDDYNARTAHHRYSKSANISGIQNLISSDFDDGFEDIRRNTSIMLARSVLKNPNIYAANVKDSNSLSAVIHNSHKWLATDRYKTNHLQILSRVFERVKQDFLADRNLTILTLQEANCPLPLIPFMNDTSITQYILDHNFNLTQLVGGSTILQVAVIRDDVETVKVLVDYDLHLHATDELKQTALFSYKKYSYDHKKFGIFGLLLEEEDPFARRGNFHDTKKETEILELLLNHKVSLYKPRADGMTPMQYLLENGSKDTVQTVLKSNADLCQKCEPLGRTALHFLVKNENIIDKDDDDFYRMPSSYEKSPEKEIKLLMRKDFDINMQDNNELSALMLSIENRTKKFPEILIKYGAKLNYLQIVANTRILQVCNIAKYYHREDELYEYYRQIVESSFLYEFDINIENLYASLYKESTKNPDSLFYAELLIANAAISIVAGEKIPQTMQNFITPDGIFRNDYFKKHYEKCLAKLKEMEAILVFCPLNGLKVKLFELLTEPDEELDRYICDRDFLSKLSSLLNKKCYRNSYYFILLRKRVGKAVQTMKLNKTAASWLCELTGLDRYGVSEHHIVVYEILSYLNKLDIENMLNAQWFTGRNETLKNKKRSKSIFSRLINKFIVELR